MNAGLHKLGSLAGRLILSLAVIFVPVFVLSPCCCVRAAIAESKGAESKASCCKARSDKEQSSDCCRKSSKAPKKSCCELTASACECCQPEARVSPSFVPVTKTGSFLAGAIPLVAEFHSLVISSESPGGDFKPDALHKQPKNRTQALLCVWRN